MIIRFKSANFKSIFLLIILGVVVICLIVNGFVTSTVHRGFPDRQETGRFKTFYANRQAPFFNRRHKFKCGRAFSEQFDQEYANALNDRHDASHKEYTTWKYYDPQRKEFEIYNIAQDCQKLMETYYFPNEPNTQYEANYPLAYSIRMSEHTDQVLKLLQAIYAPQNIYCIHVDWKSPKIIHDTFHHIAQCLPNIIIAQPQATFWGGYPQLTTSISCLNEMYKRTSPHWKHAIVLEAHDFPIRTNYEIVYILKELFKTSNDIGLWFWSRGRMRKHALTYNDQGLPNGVSREHRFMKARRPPFGITIYKSLHQVSLHRQFVQFILEDTKSKQVLEYLIKNIDFAEEAYWSTLVHNDVILKAPGSFPGSCLNRSSNEPFMKQTVTRKSFWTFKKTRRCVKKLSRNNICLFGLANLTNAIELPKIFLNKFHPRYEPVALECMHEWLFNRTYMKPITDRSKISIINNQLNDKYSTASDVQYRLWQEKHPHQSAANYPCL